MTYPFAPPCTPGRSLSPCPAASLCWPVDGEGWTGGAISSGSFPSEMYSADTKSRFLENQSTGSLGKSKSTNLQLFPRSVYNLQLSND